MSYPGNPSEILPGSPLQRQEKYFVAPQDAIVLGWNQYRIEVNNNVIRVALNNTTLPSTQYPTLRRYTFRHHGTKAAAVPTR